MPQPNIKCPWTEDTRIAFLLALLLIGQMRAAVIKRVAAAGPAPV